MKKKIVFAVVTVFVVLSCVMMLAACNNGGGSSSDGDEFKLPEGSRPSLASRISAEDKAIIEAGIGDDASVEQLRAAVIKAYDVANASRIEPNRSLMVQESLMGLKPFGGIKAEDTMDNMLASVLMHGFTLTAGDVWFNQFAANVYKVADNLDILGTMMGAMGSEMMKQSYHTADDEYYFVIIKGEEAEVDCEYLRFPYADYRLTKEPQKYEYDEFLEVTHALDAPGEIYNMDFVEDIIADNATIEYVEDGGYWDIHFEVDMSADPELLTNWYRLPQKDMQEGGQSINSYLYYRANFQLWDTGYVKSYHAEYARDAGMASSITIDTFNYLWDEDEIMNIVSDDYRLDDLGELDKLAEFRSLEDYVAYYSNAETVAARMGSTMIIIIVVAAVVAALLIFIIIREILIKTGKMPKTAAKRAARKERRKAAKENKNRDIDLDETDFEM